MSPPSHEGVLYTAASTVQTTTDLDSFSYFRIQWIDWTNNLRCVVTPAAYFKKLLKTARPGTRVTKAAMGIVFVALAEGFGAAGEYLYALDLSSLRKCPYAPGHATVLGFFQEKIPNPVLTGLDAVKVDLCPRTILKRIVEDASSKHGVEFLVGIETEFILLKSTKPVQAVNEYSWCNSAGLLSGTSETKVMEEIAEALLDSGVELQMYHSEAAPGQYEVVTGPLPPLQAVDALIHTRETIYNIASKHGLRATLAPRVFMDNCGNGAHAHISVQDATKKRPSTSKHENLSLVESQFLAGLLAHLPDVALLALPLSVSYTRMVDGVWSGGTYVCWGTDNREAPVRLSNATSPGSRNFELKLLDGTANPYLAIAAFIGAGLDGIEHEKELKIQNCEGLESAAYMGEEGRAALGITDRLPLTWEEARARFERSALVTQVFGKDFQTKYLAVNKVLKEQLTAGLCEDDKVKLLVETY